MSIVDTARALTRDVYVERRLFEILGAWSAEPGDPEAVILFATVSRHHGEHASWFAALQPVLHDVDVLAPSAELVAALDAVASSATTAERLAALDVVLGDRLTLLSDRQQHANAVSDAPVVRALGLVTTDVREDWRAASTMLRSASEASGLAAHRSHLEALVRSAR